MLCAPSVPTRYRAPRTGWCRRARSTTHIPSGSWRSETTSTPVTISTPSLTRPGLGVRSRSPLCGAMRIIGNRVSNSPQWTVAPGPRAGSRGPEMPHGAPGSSAMPRASRISRVRACTANARVMLGSSVRRSSTGHPHPGERELAGEHEAGRSGADHEHVGEVHRVPPGSWDVVATTVRRAGVRSHPWVHRCLRRWHHPIGPRGREVPMAAFTEIEGDFLRITAGLGGGGPRGVRARPLACGLVHAAAVESLAGAGDAWSGVPGGPAHRVGVAPGGEQRRCSDVASVMSPVSGPTLARCSARSCTAGRRSARWSTA